MLTTTKNTSIKLSAKLLLEKKNMKTYICVVCGFTYDEAQGLPAEGIAAGTVWADVPADWP
jgi:rubrerythrin